ncbi:MAG TPA: MFS transporter [Cellulomonas sp.]
MTVTLYGCYAVWGWLLYSFNPSVPLLARDLGISDALAGLHGTAMAAGGLVAAFLAPRAVLWWGRRIAIVAGCGAVAVGVVGLVAGPSLPWTLSAMFVLASGGNVLIASTQVGLALHHGVTASAAISEGNAVGSGIGLLGPLAVGAAVSIGWGWRAGVIVTAALAVAVAVLVERLPASQSLPRRAAPPVVHDEGAEITAGPARWHRGAAAVLFLGAIVATIAVENATDYWSTALLIDRTGAGAGIAAAATAGLVAGMTVIRLIVGPMSLRVPPAYLLAGGFLLNVVGWAVVWTTTSTGVALAGLVLSGLGLGVQYPLSIALLLAASPGHSDRAQGDATMYGALSVGVAPFLLGWLSDHVGMHTAFVAVPVFALVGAVAAVAGGRALRPAASHG